MVKDDTFRKEINVYCVRFCGGAETVLISVAWLHGRAVTILKLRARQEYGKIGSGGLSFWHEFKVVSVCKRLDCPPMLQSSVVA